MAAIGGFVLGSAVTVAVSRYFGSKKKSDHDDDEEDLPAPLSASRSIMTSMPRGSAAAAGAAGGFVLSTTSDENVGFFSDMIRELWGYIRLAGAKSIRETCDGIFAEIKTPRMRFTKVDLGTVPLRLDNIMVHPVQDGCLRMEVDVIWNGNCDMELKASICSFGVESLKLTGRMSVLFKPLTDELPVVGAIQYAFVNPPVMELDFTGLASVAEFSVLEKTVKSTIAGSLTSLVLPNRMMFKMDEKLKLFDIYEPPLGVARITLIQGHGYQEERRSLRSKDVPDVYCVTKVGNSREWRSSTIKDSLEPVWNESADFLLSDNDQVIEIHAWDEDRGTLDSDDALGEGKVSVGEVLLAGRTKVVELQQDHKATGASVTIRCDLLELTTDTSSIEEQLKTKKSSDDNDNRLYGLLTILVQGAHDLPLKKQDAASFVKITCGGGGGGDDDKEEFVTGVVVDAPGVDALNPAFESAFHLPLTRDKIGQDGVELHLINGADTVLGTTKVTLDSLLQTSSKTLTATRPMGRGGASLEFQVSLRGVAKGGKEEGEGGIPTLTQDDDETTPTTTTKAPSSPQSQGTIRLTAVKGRGFPIQKRRLKKSDIPDVYIQFQFGSSPTVWRTKTIKNSVTPEWNESKDYTLLHHSQIIHLEAFDEDAGTRDPDDPLGSGRIAVGKVLLAGGSLEVELQEGGKPTGRFVTLRCDMVE